MDSMRVKKMIDCDESKLSEDDSCCDAVRKKLKNKKTIIFESLKRNRLSNKISNKKKNAVKEVTCSEDESYSKEVCGSILDKKNDMRHFEDKNIKSDIKFKNNLSGVRNDCSKVTLKNVPRNIDDINNSKNDPRYIIDSENHSIDVKIITCDKNNSDETASICEDKNNLTPDEETSSNDDENDSNDDENDSNDNENDSNDNENEMKTAIKDEIDSSDEAASLSDVENCNPEKFEYSESIFNNEDDVESDSDSESRSSDNEDNYFTPSKTYQGGVKKFSSLLMFRNGLREKNECAKCGKKYVDRKGLKRHEKTAHLGIRYGCELCGKDFSGKEGLKRHVQSIHYSYNLIRQNQLLFPPGVRFNCQLCGKDYYEKNQLKVHVQSTHLGIRYRCEICGKDFSRSGNLKTHTRLTHGSDGNSKPYKSATPTKIRFTCHLCGKSYTEKGKLKVHIQSAHLGTRFICELCGKDFTRKYELKRHRQATHLGIKYTCAICDKSFARKRSLKTHVQSVHLGILHTCEACGRNFAQKHKKNAHYRRAHMGIDFSRKTSVKKNDVNRNVKSRIRSLQLTTPFACLLCGENFKKRNQLNAHVCKSPEEKAITLINNSHDFAQDKVVNNLHEFIPHIAHDKTELMVNNAHDFAHENMGPIVNNAHDFLHVPENYSYIEPINSKDLDISESEKVAKKIFTSNHNGEYSFKNFKTEPPLSRGRRNLNLDDCGGVSDNEGVAKKMESFPPIGHANFNDLNGRIEKDSKSSRNETFKECGDVPNHNYDNYPLITSNINYNSPASLITSNLNYNNYPPSSLTLDLNYNNYPPTHPAFASNRNHNYLVSNHNYNYSNLNNYNYPPPPVTSNHRGYNYFPSPPVARHSASAIMQNHETAANKNKIPKITYENEFPLPPPPPSVRNEISKEYQQLEKFHDRRNPFDAIEDLSKHNLDAHAQSNKANQLICILCKHVSTNAEEYQFHLNLHFQ